MAAAIWAWRLGLRAELLEARQRLGGQLSGVLSPITDYPGVPHVDGPALAARFAEHLAQTKIKVRLGCRVSRLDPDRGTLETSSGQRLRAHAIVLATGAKRRRLGLPDESRYVGRGVSYSVSKDRAQVAGQVAVIVGGGDSAAEGAVRLAALCPQVHLVHRGTLTARPDFVARASAEPRIRWHRGRHVTQLCGAERLQAVVLDDGERIGCAGLFVRIGVEPDTSFVRSSLPCDEQGFLVVDAQQRCRGVVYGVGDVCSPRAMAVSVATGQAFVACKDIQSRWC
jgi:thioredoxin reductase (NADPH)